MNRDKKLILKILRYLRDSESVGECPDFNPDYTTEKVKYHMDLCEDAGFVYSQNQNLLDAPYNIRLTWKGHEELERNSDSKP